MAHWVQSTTHMYKTLEEAHLSNLYLARTLA